MSRLARLVVVGALAGLGSCGLTHYFRPSPPVVTMERGKFEVPAFEDRFPNITVPSTPTIPAPERPTPPRVVTHPKSKRLVPPRLIEPLPAPSVTDVQPLPEPGDPPRLFDCYLGFFSINCEF